MKDKHDTRTRDLFEKAEPEMPDLIETAGIPLVNDRARRHLDQMAAPHAKETELCQK